MFFKIVSLLIISFFLGTAQIYAQTTVAQAKDIQKAFTEVADQVGKAVVAISTIKIQKIGHPFFQGPHGQLDPFFDEFFRDFFGGTPRREHKQKGLGSGVIIDKEGHILTNEHVISSADEIEVTLPDGRVFKAILKGSDIRSDLAILKIETKEEEIPVAKLGNSTKVKIGEWSIAIGNPFGFMVGNSQPTLTVGVVSALHRNVDMGTAEENRYYGNLIQTDAAINPGNSGGPLVNINGEVIGINTLIFSRSGGYQGIGFAIPINRVKSILSDLIEGKKVVYGWLGIWIQPVNKEMKEAFNLKKRGGALIFKIESNSPAEKAGLRQGDAIIELNGQPVSTPQDVINRIHDHKAGTKVTVTIIRDNRIMDKTVEIGIRPEEEKILKIEGKTKEKLKWRGITVREITEEIKRKLDLAYESGVIISQVDPQSHAYIIGLTPGDIVDELGRKNIKNLSDFNEATKEAKGNILIHTNKGYFIIPEE
ncbi:Do family serine endopeptidase [Candidatus Auribacterota bacterium]